MKFDSIIKIFSIDEISRTSSTCDLSAWFSSESKSGRIDSSDTNQP